MNIGAIQGYNNQPKFEALYVNKKGLQRSFGPRIWKQIEGLVPKIEKNYANNVDIFVYPANYLYIPIAKNDIVRVVVEKPNVPFKEKVLSALNLRPPYKVSKLCFPENVLNQYTGLLKAIEESKAELSLYM